MLNQHKMIFGGANRRIQEIKQTALTFPADNLFIQVDGMDNKKSYLPRNAVNTLIETLFGGNCQNPISS